MVVLSRRVSSFRKDFNKFSKKKTFLFLLYIEYPSLILSFSPLPGEVDGNPNLTLFITGSPLGVRNYTIKKHFYFVLIEAGSYCILGD